eukprot:TRINITY_DN27960_c0_g1_i1.p1 TRINITY_DN27960_c0_g1~~TRINITY_DN27960_c0_g1_i1.p1  ORF type:complete len:129 (+),score=2.47 TRINITY_DN27960_c0_g1_i1:218-604(+)
MGMLKTVITVGRMKFCIDCAVLALNNHAEKTYMCKFCYRETAYGGIIEKYKEYIHVSRQLYCDTGISVLMAYDLLEMVPLNFYSNEEKNKKGLVSQPVLLSLKAYVSKIYKNMQHIHIVPYSILCFHV